MPSDVRTLPDNQSQNGRTGLTTLESHNVVVGHLKMTDLQFSTSRHNFYTKLHLTPVFRVGVSPNYKGKQELGSGFCLQR